MKELCGHKARASQLDQRWDWIDGKLVVLERNESLKAAQSIKRVCGG